jgi:hypothetical protein
MQKITIKYLTSTVWFNWKIISKQINMFMTVVEGKSKKTN